jgi:hypothetical protein
LRRWISSYTTSLIVARKASLVIFVPALREAAVDLLTPLLDKVKGLNPLGS